MSVLFYISLIIFASYIIYVCSKFGIPNSISESSYLLGLKSGNLYFYFWIIAAVMPLLVYWLNLTQLQPWQFLIFLSCAGLSFVGITGRFRNSKHENTIHLISAFTCAIMAQAWALITFSYWWLISLIVFPSMYLIGKLIKGHRRNLITNKIEKTKDSVIFWVEVGLFLMAYISIFIFSKH